MSPGTVFPDFPSCNSCSGGPLGSSSATSTSAVSSAQAAQAHPTPPPATNLHNPIRIVWIGAMTGPLSKYGALQSAQLAEEDINAAIGINGHPLQLIDEDGKGDLKTALTAAMKLVDSDGVKFILGGHCTPESLAIAPFLEREKVIMLAAITSTPKLTSAGDYIFRVTPVSLRAPELIGGNAVFAAEAKEGLFDGVRQYFLKRIEGGTVALLPR